MRKSSSDPEGEGLEDRLLRLEDALVASLEASSRN